MTKPELPDEIKQLLNDARYIKDGGYSPEVLTLKLLCAFIRDQYTRTEAPATNNPVNTQMLEALKNAAQVFSNLYNSEPNSPNDWKFHLDLTLAAIKAAESEQGG